MKLLTVAVDSDGVICDLESAWLQWYRHHYDPTMTYEKFFDKWDIDQSVPAEVGMKVFDALSTGVFSRLKAYDGAIRALNELNEIANVYIVTSANGIPSAMADKANWYKQNVPFIDVKKQLVIMGDKSRFRADIMIDDRLKNITDFLHASPEGKGVYIRRYHGRNDIINDSRITEAPSLADAVKFLFPM
jgi:5'(3')-deoxyribonucleotidase